MLLAVIRPPCQGGDQGFKSPWGNAVKDFQEEKDWGSGKTRDMKKARLPHVACGLRRIQPWKESGIDVTEEQSDLVTERREEFGEIHSW